MSESVVATVEQILISEAKGRPMVVVEQARALRGKGLEGDRYATGQGHYSGDPVWDADVTLIGAEAFEMVNAEQDQALSTACLRRNLIIRGIDPHELVGRRFRIGTAEFEGHKVWPPCRYISDMLGELKILRWFAHRAGIGVHVTADGEFTVGDEVVVVPATSPPGTGSPRP